MEKARWVDCLERPKQSRHMAHVWPMDTSSSLSPAATAASSSSSSTLSQAGVGNDYTTTECQELERFFSSSFPSFSPSTVYSIIVEFRSLLMSVTAKGKNREMYMILIARRCPSAIVIGTFFYHIGKAFDNQDCFMRLR